MTVDARAVADALGMQFKPLRAVAGSIYPNGELRPPCDNCVFKGACAVTGRECHAFHDYVETGKAHLSSQSERMVAA